MVKRTGNVASLDSLPLRFAAAGNDCKAADNLTEAFALQIRVKGFHGA
jgi:hypothetical protein